MTKELSNGKIIETKVISDKPLLSTDLSLKVDHIIVLP